MGTRADFYVGRGKNAEWIGSFAFDGYPDGNAKEVIKETDERGFRESVASLLKSLDHSTTVEEGWPWPWENSRTTDYAYAFDNGKVYASCFGHPWFDPLEQRDEDHDECQGPKVDFPDMMTDKAAPAGSQKSGIMLVCAR